MRREPLELLAGRLRRCVPHELHLVELMGPEHAARVLSRRTGFAPETLRVCHEAHRERRCLEHLVAVQVRDRHFGRRDEKEVLVLHGVRVVLELRQLTSARHARAIHEVGRPDLLVAVLARVHVHEIHEERSSQSGAHAAIGHETRAADLRRAIEIDDAEALADVPVRFEPRILAGRAPRLHDAIGVLAAGGHVRQRHVGYLEQDTLELLLHVAQLPLEPRDLLAESARALDELGCILALSFALRDFRRGGIPGRLALLDCLDHGAPLALESLGAIEHGAKSVERTATPQRVAQHIHLLAQHADVVHALSPLVARRPERGSGTRSSDSRGRGGRSGATTAARCRSPSSRGCSGPGSSRANS